MWLRRAFFGWLIPAAFLLPLWLFVGWIAFDANGWALLWVFISVPAVFIGQLVLTLLVRARGTVRAHRAVSWWDALGFGVWHLLIIALGFYNAAWWAPVFALTIAVGIALLWLELWQLWREASPTRLLRTAAGVSYLAPQPSAEDIGGDHTNRHAETIIITETRRPGDGRAHD